MWLSSHTNQIKPLSCLFDFLEPSGKILIRELDNFVTASSCAGTRAQPVRSTVWQYLPTPPGSDGNAGIVLSQP